MPLTVWFSASYLIATYPDGVPAQQLEVLLAIGYKNAWLLKQKLQQCMESEALEGLVEVAHTEIRFRGADNFLDPAKSGKIIVAAAMSCLEIRLAAVPDASAASTQAFVRSNVKPGATLLTSFYPRLTGYRYAPPQGEEAPRLPITFDLLRAYRRRRHEPVDIYLNKFVVYHNDRYRLISFETVLRIASRSVPPGYGDRTGHDKRRTDMP